jgi:hypothetical protein
VPRLTVLDSPNDAGREQPGGIVDVPHPDAAARAKFSRPGPFPIAALRWSGDSNHGEPASLSFVLREHVGWLASDAADADPADVVKQVSFLRASDTVTPDEFRAHYRHHVEVARRHMPALWQYVQYDVENTSDAGIGIDAVSVLWFRSTDDFLHRYFASPEDEAEFRAQEGFLDLSKAFTFVATSHPSAAPTARP